VIEKLDFAAHLASPSRLDQMVAPCSLRPLKKSQSNDVRCSWNSDLSHGRDKKIQQPLRPW